MCVYDDLYEETIKRQIKSKSISTFYDPIIFGSARDYLQMITL